MSARQQSISVTDDQWELVLKEAERRGVNPSVVIRDLCYMGLDEEQNRQATKMAMRMQAAYAATMAMVFLTASPIA